MKNREIRRARIYGRFSSKPQERGDSRRQQIEGAKQYAERHGIEIIPDAIYFDEAVSGKHGKNLELELGRLVSECQSGEIILVMFLDRIGRQNPAITMYFLYQLTQKDITVISWAEGKNITKETMGSLESISIFSGAAIGHQENERKSKRINDTTQNHYALGEKGIQTGTLVKYLPQCFEWNDEKKKIVLNEEKKLVIKRIFDEFNSGIGKTTICHRLNQENVPTLYPKLTKQVIGKKKPWMETTIKKILKNESYAGTLWVKGRKFTCIPQVVSVETFDKAQALIKRFANRSGNLAGERVNNIFRGLSVCKHCGGTVNVNVCPPKKEGNKTCYLYRCKNARLKACKARKMLNADNVELLFFAEYFGGSPKNLLSNQNKELKEKIGILTEKISGLETKIANLLDLVEEGDKDATARMQERKSQKLQAEHELRLLRASVTEDVALPSAIEEIDSLIGSPEGNQAIIDYIPNIEKALADIEIRKAMVNVLPTVFSKVEFDTMARTIRAFKKNGQALEMKSIDAMVEARAEVAEFAATHSKKAA